MSQPNHNQEIRDPQLCNPRAWRQQEIREELRHRLAGQGDEQQHNQLHVTKPTALATAVSNPGYFFGKIVVFNDPMTEENSRPESLDETDVRA
uniref:Uncharacterized protein n=1 Tax=Leersia perrieri TaxID=77586 RepID=A0A0D9X1Y3_9ORYZ